MRESRIMCLAKCKQEAWRMCRDSWWWINWHIASRLWVWVSSRPVSRPLLLTFNASRCMLLVSWDAIHGTRLKNINPFSVIHDPFNMIHDPFSVIHDSFIVIHDPSHWMHASLYMSHTSCCLLCGAGSMPHAACLKVRAAWFQVQETRCGELGSIPKCQGAEGRKSA